MKFVIFSRGRALYSTRRLAEAGRRRGHDVRVIDPFQCILTCSDEGLQIYHEHTVLHNVDCVIPRIGAASADILMGLLIQLKALGIPSLNEHDGIALSRDKFRSLQSLAAANMPVPRTAMTRQDDLIEPCIRSVGGPPVIFKLREGTQGVGVMRADTLDSAKSIIQALWNLQQSVLIQEYIAESRGSDVRVFVVNGKIVGAMQRNSANGEFRSNLHMGGHGEPADLTKEMREIAIRAADHFGLRVAGVDLLMSRRGPLITEVNPSPGLEGIESVTGLDIAKTIIRAAEKLAVSPSWTTDDEDDAD